MRSLSCFLFAAFALAAAPVLACKGQNVRFTDAFRQVDASWGVDPDAVAVEDGKVKIKAYPSANYIVLYKGAKFTDADLCVTVQIPVLYRYGSDLNAGAVFWAQDYDNFSAFLIDPDGRAALVTMTKGNLAPIIDFRLVESIFREPGAKNVLRVTTRGSNVTAYVNDVKFASVNRRVPVGGGEFGLFTKSEDAHRDTWKFSDLKVTDLPAPKGD